jgi:hypothetical protein
MTLGIYDIKHNESEHIWQNLVPLCWVSSCWECRDDKNVMLSVVMLNVVMLSVVMLSVVAPVKDPVCLIIHFVLYSHLLSRAEDPAIKCGPQNVEETVGGSLSLPLSLSLFLTLSPTFSLSPSLSHPLSLTLSLSPSLSRPLSLTLSLSPSLSLPHPLPLPLFYTLTHKW